MTQTPTPPEDQEQRLSGQTELTTSVRCRLALLSAGGLGYLPVMPGTWGTLMAVAIHVLLAILLEGPWLRVALAAALVGVCGTGVVMGHWAERFYGRKDPQPFVLDEVAGYLLVVILFFADRPLWAVVAIAFLCSRFFDIVKLPPARQLERLRGGWGIMADDLAASVYAVGAAYLVDYLLRMAL